VSTADLRSFDELEALAAALAVFANAAREALSEADGAARSEISIIDERKRDLAWEAARLSDEYESLDEDEDGGYLQDSLYEVREELGHAEAAGARVEEAHDTFLSGANALSRIIDDRLPAARAFLERKLEQAHAYVSLHPSADSGSAGHLASSVAATAGGGGRLALEAFRLPEGFTWIPVDQIEATHLAAVDFRKVSESDIERGFSLLVREILPRIQAGPPADADVFRETDRMACRDESSGARRAFEAFFGLDAIRLDRRVGDPVFSVTNGRHRIDVARRLGLTHVPARAVEVGR
jgi:hypothetical protein